MFSARAFFVEAHKNNTIALESAFSATPDDEPALPPKFTKEELAVVGDMLKDNEVWMDGLMKVQVGLEEELWRDPVIWSKDLDERGKKLQSQVGWFTTFGG
jgi:hypoxia up-regulated 1